MANDVRLVGRGEDFASGSWYTDSLRLIFFLLSRLVPGGGEIRMYT